MGATCTGYPAALGSAAAQTTLTTIASGDPSFQPPVRYPAAALTLRCLMGRTKLDTDWDVGA